MWFRNKTTGAEWDISDPNILARVKADPKTYEEIRPEALKDSSKKGKPEPGKSG
jgi:hypothetical protein